VDSSLRSVEMEYSESEGETGSEAGEDAASASAPT
jgi:hypothetical protein